MGSYILCQTKRAETPYFIENISTNIYSLEELCYYFYNNLYLIDHSIVNEGLCSWIEEELELPRLAAKLRPYLGKFAGVEDVLYPVFKEINYLTYEELRVLNGKIQKMNREPVMVLQKQKADAMMENGMYVNAIRVYQEILNRDDLDEAPEGFVERIYHNMGCANSYLFLMDKALEYFWKAYKCAKSEKALISYLLAYRSVRTKEEYAAKVKELGATGEVKELIQKKLGDFSKFPERKVDVKKVDEMLTGFTKEYHRSTGS